MATILVIDDDRQCRTLLAHILAQRGHDISAAATGPEGIASALADPPDLVLLDVMLPDMTGYDVAARLAASAATAHVKIVYVTGLVDEAEAACLQGKLNGRPVLAKPLRPAAVFECVDAHLQGVTR